MTSRLLSLVHGGLCSLVLDTPPPRRGGPLGVGEWGGGQSWGAFLLLCVLWMQLAVLSGYPTHAVRTSMQSAVHRLLAKTPWDAAATVRWVLFIVRRLPQSLSDSVLDLAQWLQREATCRGTFYASWHLRHHGPCSDFCGDWSADLPLILSVSRMLSSSPRVDWGVHRGRGVLCA